MGNGNYVRLFFINRVTIDMRNIRIIGRLDIKAPNLVKGVHLEGLRKLGDPKAFAKKYYEQGIDEIIYMDIVASLYERNSLSELVSETAKDVFVPITVGGGLRSIDDVAQALRSGADKVAINTAAIKSPELITEIAQQFGSQCVVLSIEAKISEDKKSWEALYDNGREHSGYDVIEWAQRGESLGAGEILLTSIDQEGTAKGLDVNLVKAVSSVVDIPVICSGGMGNSEHFIDAVKEGGCDAIASAHVLHYNKLTVSDIRQSALAQDIPVRTT